jgi:hypothetical protein
MKHLASMLTSIAMGFILSVILFPVNGTLANMAPIIHHLAGPNILIGSTHGVQVVDLKLNETITFTGQIQQDAKRNVIQNSDLLWDVSSISDDSLICSSNPNKRELICTATDVGTSEITLNAMGNDGTNYKSNGITVRVAGYNNIKIIETKYEKGNITAGWTPFEKIGPYTVTYEKIDPTDESIRDRREFTTENTQVLIPADENFKYIIIVSANGSNGVNSDTSTILIQRNATESNKLTILDSYHTNSTIGITWNRVKKVGEAYTIAYKAYDNKGQLITGGCCIKVKENFYSFKADQNLRYEISVTAITEFKTANIGTVSLTTTPALARKPNPVTINIVKEDLKQRMLLAKHSRQAKIFSDLRKGSHEDVAARELASRGIIDRNTKLDKRFKINRAQGAKLMILAAQLNTDVLKKRNFTDINSGDWFKKYVQAAADYRILSGYNNGTYKPNQTMTTRQFNNMLRRTFKGVNTSQLVQGRYYAPVVKSDAIVSIYKILQN